MLIYDCEIEKAIPGKNEPRQDGIAYCDEIGRAHV